MASTSGLFSRLSKTRMSLSDRLGSVFSSRGDLDDALFEELEDQLLMSDLGVSTSQSIVESLRQKSIAEKYTRSDQLLEGLKQAMIELLESAQQAGSESNQDKPHVILMVGVNGVGKTTTLAKIANHYQSAGNKVMMAACDTFRAAAIEQLLSWGERLDIPVIAQSHGSDSAAVAFDAYRSACAKGMDYLLIDSAGRQHTHGDLMDQLKKLKRVLEKGNPDVPHEILLTVDAGNGQNVISQVENFQKAVPLTGLCVTKLDGTARGGVVIALAEKFGLPIKYIGVGEGVMDLKPFVAEEYVTALLPELPDK